MVVQAGRLRGAEQTTVVARPRTQPSARASRRRGAPSDGLRPAHLRGPGGGHQVAALGCILGGDLTRPRARLALWVALGRADDLDDVRRWFAALLR